MSFHDTLKRLGIEQAMNYLYKDPEKNLHILLDWADRFADGEFVTQRKVIREAIENPAHPCYTYIRHMVSEIDPKVMKTLVTNFFINAAMIGWPIQEEMRRKYDCGIPWAILLDPASAGSLHCSGHWAAEYGSKLNLTFEEMDSIISQGKELGVYMYIYTGGEPLVRRADLIRLCEKHDDCVFLCFTNATLINEAFADEMLRVGSLIPAISLEGDEAATDSRRGAGTYQKVQRAMRLLRERKLPYGISSCCTSQNWESITSETYYDSLIEMGACFIWYFHYMPVGSDAVPELLPTPEQRTAGLSPGPEAPGGKAPVRHGFPERRPVCGRVHCRRTPLSPYQRQWGRGPLIHSLLQRRHPGVQSAGCPAKPRLPGLPPGPALQREYAPALPHAGKPGEAAGHGGRKRRALHRPHVTGERGTPLRQMRPVCCGMEAGGGRPVGRPGCEVSGAG